MCVFGGRGCCHLSSRRGCLPEVEVSFACFHKAAYLTSTGKVKSTHLQRPLVLVACFVCVCVCVCVQLKRRVTAKFVS